MLKNLKADAGTKIENCPGTHNSAKSVIALEQHFPVQLSAASLTASSPWSPAICMAAQWTLFKPGFDARRQHFIAHRTSGMAIAGSANPPASTIIIEIEMKRRMLYVRRCSNVFCR
jgi:hypothetical protein